MPPQARAIRKKKQRAMMACKPGSERIVSHDIGSSPLIVRKFKGSLLSALLSSKDE